MYNSTSLLDTMRKRMLGFQSDGNERASSPVADSETTTTTMVPQMGRQYWMPDSISKQCYECSLQFTTIRRRHHCRICGQIFCSSCCSMIDSRLLQAAANGGGWVINETDSPINTASPSRSLRVCRYCHKYILSSQMEQQQRRRGKDGGGGGGGDYQQPRTEEMRKLSTTIGSELSSPNVPTSSSSSFFQSTLSNPSTTGSSDWNTATPSTPSSMTAAASKWLFNSITSSFGGGAGGSCGSSRKMSSSSTTPLPTNYKEVRAGGRERSPVTGGSISRTPSSLSDRHPSRHDKKNERRSTTSGHLANYSIEGCKEDEADEVKSKGGVKTANITTTSTPAVLTSFDNIRTKVAEMEMTFDGNEPKWVREIFDQQTATRRPKGTKKEDEIEQIQESGEDSNDEEEDTTDEDLKKIHRATTSISSSSSSSSTSTSTSTSSSSSSDQDTSQDEMEGTRQEFDDRSIDESTYHLNYQLDNVGEPIVRYSTASRKKSRRHRKVKVSKESAAAVTASFTTNTASTTTSTTATTTTTTTTDSPSDSFADSIRSDSLVLAHSIEPPMSPFSQQSTGGSSTATSSSYLYQKVASNFSTSLDSKESEAMSSVGSTKFINSTLIATVDRFTLYYRLLEAIYDRHALAVSRQVLADHRLSFDWLSILNEMAKKISRLITLDQHAYLANLDNFYQLYQTEVDCGQQQPVDFLLNMVKTVSTEMNATDGGNARKNYGHYPMDIRQRVKIKAIPNGTRSECMIVNGLVFTKNVAHRQMRTDIEKPKLLLFACSIGYDERRRALTTTTSTSALLKLTSFDSMRMQEASYISNLVAKIAAFKPDVIFVQGSVSRTTLELLNEYKITVVVNVKRRTLERIALFTNTYLVHSPEMLLGCARLGQCGRFRLQEFIISPVTSGSRSAPVMKKTLMFLEKCHKSIGCTVLLRGSTRYAVFRELKQVLGFMVYVHYNARLEQAYHLASGVLPLIEEEWKNCNGSIEELAKKVLGGAFRTRINSARSLKTMVSSKNEGDQSPPAITITTKTKLTTIEDNSDPLRATAEGGDESDHLMPDNNKTTTANVTSATSGSNSTTTENVVTLANKFEQLLARLPLSSSPGVYFQLPFLMKRDIYERSSMRAYFSTNLLISERLAKEARAGIVSVQHYLQANEEDSEEGLVERPDKKDDDYANFTYLAAFERERKEQETSNTVTTLDENYGLTNVGSSGGSIESSKLWRLRNHLAMRYMVTKQHPMLLNCNYDFRRQGRTYLADFRANGPQLRCVPDIFPRQKRRAFQEQQHAASAATMESAPNSQPGGERESLSAEWQQSLSVLFSVFPYSSSQRTIATAGAYCFRPRLLDITYYGSNDMSLGAFLFRHFFFARTRFNQSLSRMAASATDQLGSDATNLRTEGGASSPEFGTSAATATGAGSIPTATTGSRKVWCANEKCEHSMFRHVMRFTHHLGTVTVKFTKVSRNDMAGNENGGASVAALARLNKVLTWSCCGKCQQRSSYEEMTTDALALSFGKFLELKFYANDYYHQQWYFQATSCRHGWHQAACQFFFYDQLVAIFQYEPIRVNEVNLPAPIIPVTRNHFSKMELIHLAQQMTLKISELYSRIDEELLMIRSVAVNKINQQPQLSQQSSAVVRLETAYFDVQDIRLLDELLRVAKAQFCDLRQGIKSIHLFLTSPDLAITGVVELFRLRNMITFFIKSLVTAAANWTSKINDYVAFKRKNVDNRQLVTFAEGSLGLAGDKLSLARSHDTLDTISTEEGESGERELETIGIGEDRQDGGEETTDRALMSNLKTKLSSIISRVVARVVTNTNAHKAGGAGTHFGGSLLLSEGGSISEANNSSAALTASTALAALFTSGGGSTSKLLGTTANEETQYLNLEVNFDDINGTMPMATAVSTTTTATAITSSADPIAITTTNGTPEGGTTASGVKMFEHYHLPMYRDIAIVVKDRDLGSMIAYALTTPEYERRLAEFVKVPSNSKVDGTSSATTGATAANAISTTATVSGHEAVQPLIATNKDSPNKATEAAGGEKKVNIGSSHIDIEYKDPWGKFYCQIYFAEPFRHFRTMVLTDGGGSNRDTIRNAMSTDCNILGSGGSNSSLGEELYIFSLASSAPWNALGGKSGSTFSKTANGRFILKEVSKGELKHFLTFVPDYLSYCERAIVGRHPSALVKVVGAYQMTYKNTVTNKSGVHYILVMENLFYECSVSCIYDLKGSVRNRKVEMPAPPFKTPSVDNHAGGDQVAGDAPGNVVLLDGNLRQISTSCPLYVHQHSKLLLIEALFRDSEFLRQHGVMDYSLLVGYDEAHCEYVVGIIDYVRLFNWEKVLESRVKKIGNALDPTIVHPMNYQRRFIEAIFEYFTDVPDKWRHCLRLAERNAATARQTTRIKEDEVGDENETEEEGFVLI